ncbi:palmitoyl-protein thioesterase ABHD10, mitochondrial-like [Clarias gariepinus]|uniref:palmitoyl-protein thioesterase ABHD10, mitochondrial-like n=1 Tax=Clarias gariepinus TaxID=13013 RepID=UPI00234C1EF4|nr:palmitoyl-protein thioesterase ABHD10, mitochondrial-like [Clarias gariepinus]
MAAVALTQCRRRALQALGYGAVRLLSPTCLQGVRQMFSKVQYISRPDLPKLAYRKVERLSPGVMFLPGYGSSMNERKAVALGDFCMLFSHSYLRFDYSGHGASEGVFSEGTIGSWKKDVLFMLDEVAEGPQVLVGSGMGSWLMLLVAIARPEKVKALLGISTAADHFLTAFKSLPLQKRKEVEDQGVWTIPTKSNNEGVYTVSMDLLKEAENHRLLNGPIPITCPVRLIHGMKDEDVPWHISMQVAERVLSDDVEIILRCHGQHHMANEDDIQLMVITFHSLMQKLVYTV